MSEQTANGRPPYGRDSRLNEIVIAGLLGLLGVVLTIMFTMLFTSIQRLSDRVDENSRQITEVRLLLAENNRVLAEMQNTLQLLVSGLNIRIEPKEQAGPAAGPADAPAPNEKLATKDP